MKDHGMPFGSKGPEGEMQDGNPNQLNGAKGGGMKSVVSPGSQMGGQQMGGGMDEQKKHMLIMALMRAQQAQGGQPPMGGQPMGGQMPMGGGGGGY